MELNHIPPETSDSEPPSVTVICLCFNHEPYLAQALEGFRRQVVDFPVEFIIHDDASSDRSAAIIAEYHERHPGFLRPILQTENQFSKGVPISPLLIAKSSSKYVAWCESDDYWTNPHKLALQVKLMENDPTLAGCFHATDWLEHNANGIVPQLQLPQHLRKNRLNLDDLLEFGCLPHTSSLMFRRSALQNLELLDRGRCTGDYALCLFAARTGDLGFINEAMSVYRAHANGQWSPRSWIEKAEWAINGLVDISTQLACLDRAAFHRGLSRKRLDMSDWARRKGDYTTAIRELVLALRIAPWDFRMKVLHTYSRRLLGDAEAKRGWLRP